MRPAEPTGLRSLADRAQPGEPRLARRLEAQRAEFVEDDGNAMPAAPFGERRELAGDRLLAPRTIERPIDRLGEAGLALRTEAFEEMRNGGVAPSRRERHAF